MDTFLARHNAAGMFLVYNKVPYINMQRVEFTINS